MICTEYKKPWLHLVSSYDNWWKLFSFFINHKTVNFLFKNIQINFEHLFCNFREKLTDESNRQVKFDFRMVTDKTKTITSLTYSRDFSPMCLFLKFENFRGVSENGGVKIMAPYLICKTSLVYKYPSYIKSVTRKKKPPHINQTTSKLNSIYQYYDTKFGGFPTYKIFNTFLWRIRELLTVEFLTVYSVYEWSLSKSPTIVHREVWRKNDRIQS